MSPEVEAELLMLREFLVSIDFRFRPFFDSPFSKIDFLVDPYRLDLLNDTESLVNDHIEAVKLLQLTHPEVADILYELQHLPDCLVTESKRLKRSYVIHRVIALLLFVAFFCIHCVKPVTSVWNLFELWLFYLVAWRIVLMIWNYFWGHAKPKTYLRHRDAAIFQIDELMKMK